jgi:23S rRNA (cytosine1962-C5)-methyltransferase
VTRSGSDNSHFDSFSKKLLAAKALRERVVDISQTTVFRILNGEGDGVPGIFVDRYGDWAVSFEPREKRSRVRLDVYKALMEAWDLKGLYEKGAARSGFHPDRSPEDEALIGDEAPSEFPVRENGMRLLCRLREGARTGVYPDQRENHVALQPLLEAGSVLNLFSYTGAFSVWAALCQAQSTVSVDLSKRALEWSQRNFESNGIDLARHRHVKADAFDYLGLARRKGFRFSLVILDPPSFSTSRRGLFQAKRDWPRLIEAALKVLEPGGRLALSCNTHQISKREVLAMVAVGLGGKRSRIVKPEATLGLPADFPIPANAPWMDTLQFIVTRPITFSR